MKRPPKLSRNKYRNFAYITVNGKQIYLGKWGSPEAQAAYDRVLLNWVKTNGEKKKNDPHKGYTVTEIAVAFVADYRERPVKSDSDLQTFTRIVDRLGSLFPGHPADNFGIRDLETLRDSFREKGHEKCGKHSEYTRTYLNKLVNLTKSIFS